MKLRTLSLALTIAGVSAISTAYADDTHKSGFYAGVSGGYNDMSLPANYTDSTDGAITFSNKKYMFGLHGGYFFDLGSGFDVGPAITANYYGPAEANSANNGYMTIHDYSIGLQATGQYTWQSFFARAHVGESYFFLRGEPTNSNNAGDNENQWKPVAGLSIGYYFTPSINVGLFYDHVFGSNMGTHSDVISQPSMNSLGLSLEYAFGGIGDSSN
jgi:hypothetical protein